MYICKLLVDENSYYQSQSAMRRGSSFDGGPCSGDYVIWACTGRYHANVHLCYDTAMINRAFCAVAHPSSRAALFAE